jgi:hypothetical protein
MSWFEHDNRGIRHETVQEATAYWMVQRKQLGDNSPFVMYEFPSREAAHQALLKLPCIRQASDTGNLICIESLMFGYYQTDSAHWEAVICGEALTVALWRRAHEAFEEGGGARKNDLKPKEAQPRPQGNDCVRRLIDSGYSAESLAYLMSRGAVPGSGGQPNTQWRFDVLSGYLHHPDVSGATLDGYTFFDIVFDGALMNDMVLTNCGFLRCSFENTSLRRTRFVKARFENCRFSGPDLAQTDFVDCILKDTYVPGRASDPLRGEHGSGGRVAQSKPTQPSPGPKQPEGATGRAQEHSAALKTKLPQPPKWWQFWK